MHIYIASVNWPNDVKARPVLILEYQLHNFTEPQLLKLNNELTISYWINRQDVPNKAVIKSKDPIFLIMKKHTYKIKY